MEHERVKLIAESAGLDASVTRRGKAEENRFIQIPHKLRQPHICGIFSYQIDILCSYHCVKLMSNFTGVILTKRGIAHIA